MFSFSEFEDGSKGLSAEALRDGVVSRVKGFNVVQSEDVGSATAANNQQLGLVGRRSPSRGAKHLPTIGDASSRRASTPACRHTA